MILRKSFSICMALFVTCIAWGGSVIQAQGIKGKEALNLFSSGSTLFVTLNGKEQEYIKKRVEKFFQDPQFSVPGPGKKPLKTVSLGQPLPIFHIQLNKIRAYNQEGSPTLSEILTPTEGLLLPLGPEKKSSREKLGVQSFVPLIRESTELMEGMRYRAGVPKQKTYYRWLFDARSEVEKKERKAHGAVQSFGIHYPALGRYFLGYVTDDENITIKVLQDGPGNLKRGQERLAHDVFAVLSEDANENRNKEYESAGNPLKQFRQLRSQQ